MTTTVLPDEFSPLPEVIHDVDLSAFAFVTDIVETAARSASSVLAGEIFSLV